MFVIVQIHWFSIVNSCVTVLLLTGFLATILLRVVKNDFVRFMRDEEARAQPPTSPSIPLTPAADCMALIRRPSLRFVLPECVSVFVCPARHEASGCIWAILSRPADALQAVVMLGFLRRLQAKLAGLMMGCQAC